MINSIPYYPYQQNVQILKGFFFQTAYINMCNSLRPYMYFRNV